MRTIKCVVVGDAAVGKTSLLISYMINKFPIKYRPTPFDYTVTVSGNIGEDHHTIFLRDTRGDEDHDRLRPLSYGQTDVCLICFSITSPTSLESIRIKWFPEVYHYCPQAPRLVVATQVDLRENPQIIDKLSRKGQKPVTRKMGERLAKDVGAKYVECSAVTQEGLASVIDEAIISALTPPPRHHRQQRDCVTL